MGSKRRYKPITEEHRVYHRSFDRYRLQSKILNSGGEIPNHQTIIFDQNNLKGILLELKGNEKGMWFRTYDNSWNKAALPIIEEQLQEINLDFKIYQQQRVNRGFPKTEKMPRELREKKFKLEARQDVLREEIEEIERRLKEFTKREEQGEDSRLLCDGPTGTGKLTKGILVEIAGQKVRLDRNSVLIIDDSRSPYDGMLVADYREHVSEPWVLAKRLIERERSDMQRELGSQGRSDSFVEEWRKRMDELNSVHSEWRDLFALKFSGKPSMPQWPEGVKNYKK